MTIKGLPRGCDENAIFPVLDTIAMYIGTVAKLQMIDSSSAAVDMETDEGAKMLAMYGNLEIDGKSCALVANFKAEQAHQEPRRSTDWVCVKCNTMNFARRQECFQCQASRLGNSIAVEDTGQHDDMRHSHGAHSAAAAAKEETTLLVRDIPELSSEQSVRTAFNPFGQLYEVRHLPERRLAFVEFDNISCVQQAMRQADERGIRVDGQYVTCTIARGRDNPPSDGDKSGAHAAIEQAMAMAQARNSSKGRKGRDGDQDADTHQAEESKFKLDPQSGYFYNSETEQYYDQESGVYYTYKNGAAFYFDPTSSDYVACAAVGSTLPPGSDSHGGFIPGGLPSLVPDAYKKSAPLGVPKAKKKKATASTVATAMTKSKKSQQDLAQCNAAGQADDEPPQQGAPVLPAKANLADFKFEVTNFNVKKETAPIVAPLSPSTLAAALPVSAICYLCNRKFPSQEKLQKHANLSQLHKDNLAKAAAKERGRRAAAPK